MADYEDDSDADDEMFFHLAARGRIARNFRQRPDNLNIWSDEEFFMRFRLTKPTVLSVLEMVEHELEYETDRYVRLGSRF
jgi:hypothetical protein